MFAAIRESVEIPLRLFVRRDKPSARLKGYRVADAMIKARFRH